ncbi:ATP-binding cassette domain-containing protein [Lapidilactobacillus wuchangensis]|uniref:ATP-binding cassette domain-containing protein n=1 Tax=Lapidilactobacillus wuchangensis TaxID=2486001 RepID=UPI000F7A8D22|nr:ATP-binding cassette domain-containing protein [Lapidilactobacillus wuchangensis]
MIAIKIKQLKKSFGQLTVLNGIDLEVQQGEVFTLLGENGAGKSTLINILTTLSRADSGQVTILGLNPQTQGAQVRQQISLNSQTMTLDQEFSGIENLRLIAKLRNVADPEEVIAELVTGLDCGLCNSLSYHLSTRLY